MPPPLGDNRFALLSASPQRKRKKAQTITKELFPALPAVIKENPKYLIASALDTSKPLSKYSCFAVHKALKNVNTDIINISELKDGNLLLFVKNMNIANKFLQTIYHAPTLFVLTARVLTHPQAEIAQNSSK